MKLTPARMIAAHLIGTAAIVAAAIALASLIGPQCVHWYWNGQKQEFCSGEPK